jgi:hypothetical protein
MPRRLVIVAALFAALSALSFADDPPKDAPKTSATPLTQQELIKKLATDLTNVKLIGKFTITGKEDREPKAEEYTITSALKLPEGDIWLLKARIKYGDKDVTVPIPLEIKWAGDTPIITLTDVAIPPLGTFSSRVVIYEGRYAGTWQHGKVGGHLFGVIEKVDAEKTEAK